MTDNTTLVSIILVNGQIVLAEANPIPDNDGFILLMNPVRPILIENTIEFVAFNSFSDSSQYPIHVDNIISISEMHFQYIDKYIESIDRIDKEIYAKYQEMMQPVQAKKSIYVDNESTTVN